MCNDIPLSDNNSNENDKSSVLDNNEDNESTYTYDTIDRMAAKYKKKHPSIKAETQTRSSSQYNSLDEDEIISPVLVVKALPKNCFKSVNPKRVSQPQAIQQPQTKPKWELDERGKWKKIST